MCVGPIAQTLGVYPMISGLIAVRLGGTALVASFRLGCVPALPQLPLRFWASSGVPDCGACGLLSCLEMAAPRLDRRAMPFCWWHGSCRLVPKSTPAWSQVSLGP